ncbi:MAG: hypothetical protein IH986_07410 [Planctomycetes bacterium]|nr:hypothetical protein [Planctomycetota bacterium]
MLRTNRAVCSLVGLVVTVSARAQITTTETFEQGTNPAGWTFGTGNERIEPNGGNPGRYLHDPVIDTFAPRPRTGFGTPSVFVGDYRTRQVTRVGIDLITHRVDFSAAGRPLSVILISDNGTPNDFLDDWGAYHIGPRNVPLVGEGWLSYSFDIPAQAPTLPVGWNIILFGPNSPPNPDWNDVITDVAQLQYFYGDPTRFFIFQVWNLGLDNASITHVPPIAGDMNCDGVFNGGDIDPFFLALGDPPAYSLAFPNCDPLNGDMNNDNRLDGGDIDPFFECLGGGNCP